MLAVPSLVGTGTAVAVATAGLALAEPEERIDRPPTARPSLHLRRRRALTSDFASRRFPSPLRPSTSSVATNDGFADGSQCNPSCQPDELLPSPLFSHPPNTARPQQPPHSQRTPPKPTSRRHSFLRQTDTNPRPVAEHARDSISSNGSWMRRLSIRPISQHGSPRSSIGPDSPSLFSHGSGAPMLSPDGSRTPQLPPNKLVKRGTTPSQTVSQDSSTARRGSKSQLPTLRRPATSHQRSATLQQFGAHGGFPTLSEASSFPLDQQLLPSPFLHQAPAEGTNGQQEGSGWMSFFHSRTTKGSGIGRGIPDSPSVVPGPNKRVQLPLGSKPRAFLVKAHILTGSPVRPEKRGSIIDATHHADDDQADTKHITEPEPYKHLPNSGGAADETPKRTRRSNSLHFSSPTTWIPKTGSIRRPKRGSSEATKPGDQRNVSDSTASSNGTSDQPKAEVAAGSAALDQLFVPDQPHQQSEPETASNYHTEARKRNSSSPLPPLSRLSSFNIDVSRAGLNTAPSLLSGPRRSPHMAIPSSASSHSHTSLSQSRTVSGEGASTVVSSDLENHFTSGEDEDADDRSDTMYDSFRTGVSARLRSVETPLESVFDDESPPCTAGMGNNKTKRLSIQEILGRPWDGDTDIVEEDENTPTPVRASHGRSERELGNSSVDSEYSFHRKSFPDAEQDLPRFSLDDDDDDDWARDEDVALSNHLSPPTNSLSYRRGSPRLLHLMTPITDESCPDAYFDRPVERPRSNIFDWSEPTSYDKYELDGYYHRPKTASGKQALDLRGGRPTNRKGPSAAYHVRSQSVPVVPDNASDSSKVVPKFGTWGIGTKTVSEDWDDDFELDEGALSAPVGGKDSATSFSLVVPPQIQTIQNTVKAHSGQIRELSLLVNDLKRLCRHGKELNLQDGLSAAKWKEAENIIELAAPDEDEEEEDEKPKEVEQPVVPDFDASSIDDRFLDEGFDALSLEHKRSLASLSIHSGDMSKTAVVRERQVVRRRSVFPPDDDIFGGNWPLSPEAQTPSEPRTPDPWSNPPRDSAMISTVIDAMQQQRSAPDTIRRRSPVRPSQSRLFFDTNSLQELVKRASHLRDSLSDMVRRAEFLTQSPSSTPHRDRRSRRSDGSPAFTRVFTEPSSSPPGRLPRSHSSNTVLTRTSVDSPRLQMMTVS